MRHLRTRAFPDERDLLLILAVLGASFFALRHTGGGRSTGGPVPAAGGSAAMDGLWRDSVRPLKEHEDVRPVADDGILWDERVAQARPAPPPPEIREAPARPEEPEETAPLESLRPRRAVETRAARPKPHLVPTGISFSQSQTTLRSKAFLPVPGRERRGY